MAAQNSKQIQQPINLPIFTSSVNAESKLKFLGQWIPIIRGMFDQKRKSANLEKAELFAMILQHQYEKIDLLADLFGVEAKVKK